MRAPKTNSGRGLLGANEPSPAHQVAIEGRGPVGGRPVIATKLVPEAPPREVKEPVRESASAPTLFPLPLMEFC